MSGTVADVLFGRLAELGVGRLYVVPEGFDASSCASHGIHVVRVDDPDVAVLLADADGRIGHRDGRGRLGAALVSGPIVHLSSRPGGVAPLQTIGSPEDLVDALAVIQGVDVPGTNALHLDLDLEAPVDPSLVADVVGERVPVLTLDPSMGSLRLVAVVGPGVVRAGAVDALRSFARFAGAGIVNSWGAKGVERWDSPFHFGTAGLQEHDLALAGIADADVVIASGLDATELAADALGHAVVQEVAPAQLAALCHRWERSAEAPTERPALYRDLATLVTPLYESDSVPLTPARAALHLSGALPDGGVAVVDPGAAGLWVARTFPTSFPGSVCVPSTIEPGFAAAAALVCSFEGRPCLAVTGPMAPGSGANGEVDSTTERLLDLARSLGVGLALQQWGDAGDMHSFEDHVALLADHLRVSDGATDVRVDAVPVDFAATADLVDVAGPVVAWGGSYV